MLRAVLWCLAASFLLSAPVRAEDLTAAEIVDRYVAAHGGLERWREVQTLRFRGRMDLGYEVEVPFVQELKRPNKTRFEFVFRGETAVQAFDGENGWKHRPYAGYPEPESMSGDEVASARRDADFDGPLFDYRAKGHSVELVGRTEIDGRDAYELKVTLAGGAVQRIFLDAGSLMEIGVTRRREVRGTPKDVTTYKADYRWIDGLLLPFALETGVAGSPERRKLIIEKVEVDVPIEDSRFERPTG